MTKKKKQIDFRVVITGIICLTVLEGIALLKGIDGTMFTISAALIGAATGAIIPLDKIVNFK